MSRFRPTSFRVAFGNIADDELPLTIPTEQKTPPPPPPPSAAVVLVAEQEIEMKPQIRRIQIAEENTGFERIVVRGAPCQQCQCYQCSYYRRMHEHKINVLLFLVFMIFVMLLVMAFKKSD